MSYRIRLSPRVPGAGADYTTPLWLVALPQGYGATAAEVEAWTGNLDETHRMLPSLCIGRAVGVNTPFRELWAWTVEVAR